MGVNSRVELAIVNAAMRRRLLERLMLAGVTVEDPDTTYVDWGVEVGRDTLIRANTHLLGRTTVGAACEVGPGSFLRDAFVGDRARVVTSHLLRVRHRIRLQRRALRLHPPQHRARRGRQGRHLRRDQEQPHRRGQQGAAPQLRRRRRHRPRQQHRRRQHHRQLRRLRQARDDDRRPRAHRQRHDHRGAGDHRRRRLHGRRLGDHPRRAGRRPGRRPRPAEEHRRLRRASRRTAAARTAGGRPRRRERRRTAHSRDRHRGEPGGAAPSHFGTIDSRSASNTNREATRWRRVPAMCTSPQQAAHDLLGAQQPGARREASPRSSASTSAAYCSRPSPTARSTPATTRASAAPTPSSSSRRPTTQRRAHGAAHHDPGGAARLGEAHHRRHALLPVLAPGQEERRARAHHGAARRHPARGRAASTASFPWTCTRVRSRASSRSRSTT